jgi:hypothetical protein
MTTNLSTLVLTFMAAISPGAEHRGDASSLATAIASTIESDPLPPVFGTKERDAAMMALYAWHESNFAAHPTPQSWDAKAGKSCGYWQQACLGAGTLDVIGQARMWLWQLHEGAKICPDSPAAPLSGGCSRARRVADARTARVDALLSHLETSDVAGADPADLP